MPVEQPAAVDLDDAAGQLLHQQAVVGDDDDGAGVGGQEVFQPGDGVDVQVVGGLVEHEDVGTRHQRPGQQGAPLQAGGEGAELGFGGQLHPGDDQVDLAVDLPAVLRVQLLPQAVQAGQEPGVVASPLRQQGAGMVVIGQQPALGRQAGSDDVDDRAGDAGGDLLVQAGGGDALAAADRAAVRDHLAVDQLHQRGLAAAVAPQQADPFVALDVQVDAVEQQEAAVADAHVLHAEQSHSLIASVLFSVGKDSILQAAFDSKR